MAGSDESPSDEEVIRGWTPPLNDGRLTRRPRTASPRARSSSRREARLPTRAQAIAFNRSLPCRAEVTDIEDEDGRRVARQRSTCAPAGPGECSDGGTARVRFVIEDGLIREWRQLPEAPLPSGSQSA